MQKQKLKRRSIQLDRETVALLSKQELKQVQGGMSSLNYRTVCSTEAVECRSAVFGCF